MASLQERVKRSEAGQFLQYAQDDFKFNSKTKATLECLLVGGAVGLGVDYLFPQILPEEPYFAFDSAYNIFLEGAFPMIMGKIILDYVSPVQQTSLYLGSILAQAMHQGMKWL